MNEEEIVLTHHIRILNENLLEPVTRIIKELQNKEMMAMRLPHLVFDKCLSDDDFAIFETGVKMCKNLTSDVPKLSVAFKVFCDDLFASFNCNIENSANNEWVRQKRMFFKFVGQLYAYEICTERKFLNDIANFFMDVGDEVHIEYLKSLVLQIARLKHAGMLYNNTKKRMEKMRIDGRINAVIRNLIDEALVAIRNNHN